MFLAEELLGEGFGVGIRIGTISNQSTRQCEWLHQLLPNSTVVRMYTDEIDLTDLWWTSIDCRPNNQRFATACAAGSKSGRSPPRCSPYPDYCTPSIRGSTPTFIHSFIHQLFGLDRIKSELFLHNQIKIVWMKSGKQVSRVYTDIMKNIKPYC